LNKKTYANKYVINNLKNKLPCSSVHMQMLLTLLYIKMYER